eukprot:14188161-Ditylum_brightwellii.AAC.1
MMWCVALYTGIPFGSQALSFEQALAGHFRSRNRAEQVSTSRSNYQMEFVQWWGFVACNTLADVY